MSSALRCLALCLLLAAGRTLFAQAQLETLLTNGPTANLLNIVILAEGFTGTQEETFRTHASATLEKFLSTAPYSAYRSYFNAFGIFVPSTESGSDHPTRGISRDTYFNSTYDSFGIQRLITIDWVGAERVNALLQELLPEYDIVLLLVNDSEYGGSGGFPAVTSINSSAAEIAIHEIGHSFAGLGDEYETPFPGYPDIEEPNTTKETRREFIKWNDWILGSTPIPTPQTSAYAAVVGLFEGAHFHSTGWYRPKLDCKMRTLGRPFCEVCSEAIVLACYDRIDMILSHSPLKDPITLNPGKTVSFQVNTLEPVNNELIFSWSVNGVIQPGENSAIYSLSADSLSALNTVQITVRDQTSLVRTDPASRLLESRSWQVALDNRSPPTLSSIPDQVIYQATSTGSLAFTVDGFKDEGLILFSSSSNPALVPPTSIEFGGAAGIRTVTVTPAPLETGEAMISINASDGEAVSRITFKLIVKPWPFVKADPPELTGSDLKVRFSSPEPVTLVLQRSVNLFDWTPIHTNVSAFSLEYTTPILPAEKAEFFRVRVLPPQP